MLRMISTSIRLSVRALMVLLLFELLTLSSGEGIKRVPQGFMGMRGKKYLNYDDTGTYEKRRQGFVGVKGKKDAIIYPYELKRAPTGFVGMRGKKFDPYDVISAEYVPKRGSILGQIDYNSGEIENGDFSVLNELLEKYLLESDLENEIYENNRPDLTKRAAQMNQFFGMRGKKSDPSYRGNKRPFDLSFRGKFVGVRGKKSIDGMEMKELPENSFVGMSSKSGDNEEFPTYETTHD